MAEAAGLVIGAVGLVSLASTVSDAFAKIETAQNLGAGFVQVENELAIAKLKYARWRDTVLITDSASGSLDTDLEVASPSEAEIVRNLLGGIETAFDKASKQASKYIVPDVTQAASNSNTVRVDSRVVLAARITERADRHQRNASLFRKMKWSLHDEKALRALASIVSANVTNLVDMFPATRASQQRIAAEDVRTIAPPGDTSRLELLTAAATNVDPMLQSAAKSEMKRQGHTYSEMEVGDKVRVLYGNEYAKDVSDPGLRHDYHNIRASGEARIIYGDKVGYAKSVLDD